MNINNDFIEEKTVFMNMGSNNPHKIKGCCSVSIFCSKNGDGEVEVYFPWKIDDKIFIPNNKLEAKIGKDYKLFLPTANATYIEGLIIKTKKGKRGIISTRKLIKLLYSEI